MLPPAETLISFGTGGLSVGVGLYAARQIGRGISWLIVFFTGRIDRKEAAVDAGMEELVKHLREQVAILVGDCRELRDWRAVAERDLHECKRRHAESEAEVMRMKAAMQGYGDARNHAQLIVAAEKAVEKDGNHEQ